MHPITCIFISINNIFIQSNILNSVFDPFLKSLHSNAHARNRFMFYNQIQEMESCEKQLSKAIEQLNSILVIIFSDDIPSCSPHIALSMVSVLFWWESQNMYGTIKTPPAQKLQLTG